MSAAICPKCGGWHGVLDDDLDWVCSIYAFTLYRTAPLPRIKEGTHISHTPGSQYDRLDGVKPIGKGPGSLAR